MSIVSNSKRTKGNMQFAWEKGVQLKKNNQEKQNYN